MQVFFISLVSEALLAGFTQGRQECWVNPQPGVAVAPNWERSLAVLTPLLWGHSSWVPGRISELLAPLAVGREAVAVGDLTFAGVV